jgi:hypothetical protein
MRVKALLLGIVISGGAWSEEGNLEMLEVADSTPSMELLEFLGTFQNRSGRWVDPLLLEPVDEEKSEVTIEPAREPGEMPVDEAQNDDQ